MVSPGPRVNKTGFPKRKRRGFSSPYLLSVICLWTCLLTWVQTTYESTCDGDQDQEEMEANNQGQEEVEAQVLDAQGVISPSHRLTRSKFKALGNSGRLFSLFLVSCVIKGA